MDGFKRKTKVYNLAFDDEGEYAGLTVRVKSMSVGKVRAFIKVRTAAKDAGEDEAAAASSMDSAFDMFAECLLSWNLLDDDDNQVPANREGIDTQDIDFIMAIISAWMETITGVPDETPLHGQSSDGAAFPVASIPMEPLSASRAS